MAAASTPYIGGNDDRLGTEPPRLGAVHGGAYTEGPGLVAGRHDHPTADDHRPPSKSGVVALLDRGEEGIEVGVEDRRIRRGHEHTFAIVASAVNPLAAKWLDASTMGT